MNTYQLWKPVLIIRFLWISGQVWKLLLSCIICYHSLIFLYILQSVRYSYFAFWLKIISQELDSAKERLSYNERESCEKHNQEDTYETENLDLLQRKSEFEDKHKVVSGKLEDTRVKHECLTQDLTNLTMNLERIWYVWLIFSFLFVIIALYYNF
jgi:hypothetical protein